MKRRYANQVEGEYIQKRIDGNYFKGYACYIKIKDIKQPLVVNNGIKDVCIKDENYEWFEVYPDDSRYAITIIFDDNNNLIEWYFDIAKSVGIENGVPYEEDLYLDMVIMPNGEKLLLDENELLDAFYKGDITQDDINIAYQTLKELESKYVNNLEDLIRFTNYLCNIFKSNNKII